MTWTPTEPGRWLYHCHRLPHMRMPIPLDPKDVAVADDHAHMHDMDSEYDGMGGMILGITVNGKPAMDTSTGWKPERQLSSLWENAMEIRGSISLVTRPGSFRGRKETAAEYGTHRAGHRIESEPAGGNFDRQQTPGSHEHSLAWHRNRELLRWRARMGGMAIEDTGGRAWANVYRSDGATARGTFIYHTHWHDDGQLTGGVQGTLIVLPKGQTYDPATDKVFFQQGPNEPFGAAMMLMNGTPEPARCSSKRERPTDSGSSTSHHRSTICGCR